MCCFLQLPQALANRGAPDVDQVGSDIPVRNLPHCKKSGCKGLLRPHIVWFGESLESAVLEKAGILSPKCSFTTNLWELYIFSRKTALPSPEFRNIYIPYFMKWYHFAITIGLKTPRVLSTDRKTRCR